MNSKIEKIISEIDAFKTKSKAELESFRIKFLGKKGEIQALFADFKQIPSDQKRQFGQKLNELKNKAESKFKSLKEKLEDQVSDQESDLDLTLPPQEKTLGSRHPISIVRNQIIDIFERLGFNISEGPEIVTDWENFEALNFEPHHPAREMQDTFFVQSKPDVLLRTHTSSVQVQEMKKALLPIRTISPGRVYRNETISARSHYQFHQIEGLYIAEKVSFADLRQTLYHFAKELFGASKVRFRPSYFPFTEPSAEMDIYWGLESEADYRITKGTGWLEILGCGMVDPNVLKNCGIDPEKYIGYAFGMGVERIAMLKYQITDIRLLFENDVRFLKQFASGV